jgi:ribosome-binding protein aMBF1 (putative translation factor)
MKCRAIIPPAREGCGAPVTHCVTFKDGDKVTVCGDCALRFGEIAQAHGSNVRVEKLPLEKADA